jgi:hypothetical protein
MRPYFSAFSGGRMPRFLGILAGIAASAVLVACASSDGGSGGGGLSGLFGGAAKPNAGVVTIQDPKLDANYFAKAGYCPPVQILPGTESMVIYEKGHDGGAAFVRTQGSITNTARECHALDATTLSIKLGVGGRILAGPKGGAGTVTMPIRIAVARQHDNSVLFSKAFPVTVNLAAPDFGADYSQVFDQVQFTVGPDDRDLIIYVGFDEGAPKKKAGT